MTSSKQIKTATPSPLTSLLHRAEAIQSAAHRHPRRVSAAVLALLAGSAVTAFGVAPLTTLPDTGQPAVVEVVETVQAPALAAELGRLDAEPLDRKSVV